MNVNFDRNVRNVLVKTKNRTINYLKKKLQISSKYDK